MTEILFYHLKAQTPEQVLPSLLQKSLQRGWRVVVQCASEERIDAIDAHLWTWQDDTFLPHGTWRDSEAAQQPILITTKEDNPNGAVARFLLDGASLPPDTSSYQRIIILFDGEDPDALAAARTCWSAAKVAGVAATYWRADEAGRWQREA